jgi:uncharacterized membrane protein YfcA
MGFIQFLLILAIIIIVFLMLPLRFKVRANFDNNGKYASIFFLYPLLQADIVWDGLPLPVLKIFLFKNRIFKKQLKMKRKPNKHPLLWARSAVITNKKADIWYGARNPFATGLASGALGAAMGFISFDELKLYPDFFATEDYVRVSSSAEITLGNTILNYVKNKRNKTRRNNEWSKA